MVMAAWSAIASSSVPSFSPHASRRLLKTVSAPIGPPSTISGAAMTEWSPDRFDVLVRARGRAGTACR